MAREPKNTALPRSTSIDALLGQAQPQEVEVKTNIAVNDAVENNIEVTDKEANPLAALKAEMQQAKKKEANKQVTVYLTPENFVRFNALKEKGQKSELINKLLDMYFSE